jgi:DNA invertase Pin-like site-specific DNA recombinase
MNEFLIGYARVSTNEQDLTAQQNALQALGVRSNLIYTDHGLTGTNRARPGLREALAACRDGDTLVVAKLDRLARSLRDTKDIIDELTIKGVKLSLGGSVHDPPAPVVRLLFNVLVMVAELESDLIHARPREGVQVAKAKGQLHEVDLGHHLITEAKTPKYWCCSTVKVMDLGREGVKTRPTMQQQRRNSFPLPGVSPEGYPGEFLGRRTRNLSLPT